MAAGLTLQELADLVGMTPRNVRAYQSRGLLPPPLVDGRIAHYDAHHVARLVLVRSLQEQGFNLEGIRRIIAMTSLYGPVVAEGAGTPRDSEAPLGETLRTIEQVRPGAIDELVELGILRRDGDTVLVAASLAGVGARTAEEGLPVALLIDLLLPVARTGHEAGTAVREHVRSAGTTVRREEHLVGLARAFYALALHLAFSHGAGRPTTWAPGPELDEPGSEAPAEPPGGGDR